VQEGSKFTAIDIGSDSITAVAEPAGAHDRSPILCARLDLNALLCRMYA
jgi:hypothetical protein